eukprot:gene15975-18997_t
MAIDNDRDISGDTIISSTIKIVKLIELNPQGMPLATVIFDNWEFTNNTGDGHLSYMYTTSVLTGPTTSTFTNLTVLLELFNTFRTMVNQDTLESSCSVSNMGATNGDENQLEWIKMTVNGRSLFTQFLPRCVLDGRSSKIGATLLNKDNVIVDKREINSQIALNIPYYLSSVSIDPNFLFLVEDPTNPELGECAKTSKKSSIPLIGIICGLVVVALVALAGAIFIFKRRFRINMDDKRSMLSMSLVKRG